MDTLRVSFKKQKYLHHAYIVEGDIGTLFSELVLFLSNDVVDLRANPDFWHATYDIFGIEEGRMLRDMQSRKAFTVGAKKIFIVSFNFITHEAQHALLKVLEEPTQDTHFFILVPESTVFIPTVLSRVHLIRRNINTEKPMMSGEIPVRSFVSASPAQRISMIAPLIEGKEKMKVIEWINSLEYVLYKQWKEEMNKEHARVLQEISTCRAYLFDRAPSIKMILEHLALCIPRTIRD